MNSLTYVYHDCFVLQTPGCVCVFDYWCTPSGETAAGELPWFLKEAASSGKPLYVFVSHHHKDHYNKEIFEWQKWFANIKYILSKDTARFARHILRADSLYSGTKVGEDKVAVLRAGESFDDGVIRVDAFASTDIGCSYAVNVSGIKVFHAGDLNAWMWKDESTVQEVNKAIGDYESILRDVALAYPELDLAMFPVDSRIGRDYWEGAARLVRKIDVKRFVPMHFELADSDSEREQRHRDAFDFEAYANPERGEYIALGAPGDCLAW